MVKLLVCGSINGEWILFIDKITSLQKSAHGPFDFLVCSGVFFRDEGDVRLFTEAIEQSGSGNTFDIPTYIFGETWLSTSSLPGNIHILPNCGMLIVNNSIRIACVAPSAQSRHTTAFESLVSQSLASEYRGCDMLVSAEWPAGVFNELSDSEINDIKNISNDALSGGSQSVSLLACYLKPRYLMTGAKSFFYQRSPYKNEPFKHNSSYTAPYTRVVSLCSVSSSKEKTHKYIHALSLDPMYGHGFTETSPPVWSSCPFGLLQADSGNEKDNTNTSRDKRSRDGDSLDHNGLKKASVLLPSFSQEAAGVNAGSFFFGNKGQQRPDSSFAQSSNQKNFSEDSKVIYMGGIPEGANEGVIRELLGIHGLLNDVISVKINTGKPFAFVEFRSHAAAKTLFELGEGGLIIGNRRINIGWGKGKPRAEQDSTSAYRRPSHATVLQPPSDDAKTLFVGGIPANTTSEQIKSLFPHPERVQAVNMPEGKNFAFVELATHDDALISIQSAQSSSGEDGGSPCFFLDGVPLGLGWAKGRSKDDLGFGSKHDTHKMDCWFCLASPTAKLHLVVSVSDHMYLALPRGGLSPYHVLVVPIECVPSRIHLSQLAKANMEQYVLSLEKFYATRNLACIIYERAIRTKGRDHMQLHCVPIAYGLVQNAMKTFISTASSYNINFHEILDERDVDEVALAMEGGPYQEYFYIEIPMSNAVPPPPNPNAPAVKSTPALTKRRRFIYVHADSNEKGFRFPMQFGNEVAAKAMDRPEKAQWQNCVQSETDEIRLTEEFRQQFEPFDETAK